MRVSKLKLPAPAIGFLEAQGFSELYPPQAQSVKAGLLGGKSQLVSAPTASGKTLIAMIAIINFLSKNSGKAVYLSPLKALASEKFSEFAKLKKIPLGRDVRIAVSTGDSADRGLGRADVLVLTNEKMDSLLRNGPAWTEEIGLVIADEVHLIGDAGRGPTLEMVLTKMRQLKPRPQIVGLSATVTNAAEISKWLGSVLVESDWRPVPLSEGVYNHGTVTMGDGECHTIDTTVRGPAVDLGIQCVADGGQSLIFAGTRASSAATAAKAADAISRMLGAVEKRALAKASGGMLAANEHTKVVRTLAELVGKGVAFHHAGLNQDCRERVEAEFRQGRIKLLSSTPTLAAGVNLPARRVVISTLSRYDARVGMNMPISVLEYKQLCGRAGRPQYDEFGEAIIVGRSNPDEIIDHYIHGRPEPIESQMAGERALQTHTLSLVVTTPGTRERDIVGFFLGTLGGKQNGRTEMEFGVGEALESLLEKGMLHKKTDRFIATEFGRLVSRLYMDPETAVYLRETIEEASEGRPHTLGFLHAITECGEFFPRLGMRQGDHGPAGVLIADCESETVRPITTHNCSRSLLAMHAWITESTELSLSEGLGVESGDMHRMAETGARMAYCLGEIARQQQRGDLLEEIGDLRRRIIYGVGEELLELVGIRGVGRVRARALYRRGIRGLDDLSAIPVKKLASIGKIGPALAESIKQQLARR